MNAEIDIFFNNHTALEIEVLLNETFHCTSSFLLKIPAEYDLLVLTSKIKVRWKEVGGEEQKLIENGIQYLYHQLSVDGVKLLNCLI